MRRASQAQISYLRTRATTRAPPRHLTLGQAIPRQSPALAAPCQCHRDHSAAACTAAAEPCTLALMLVIMLPRHKLPHLPPHEIRVIKQKLQNIINCTVICHVSRLLVRNGYIYPFLFTSTSTVPWESWLIRSPHTRKIPSSSLGGTILPHIFFCIAIKLVVLSSPTTLL